MFNYPSLCKYLTLHQKAFLLQFTTAAVLVGSARFSRLCLDSTPQILHFWCSFYQEKYNLRVQGAPSTQHTSCYVHVFRPSGKNTTSAHFGTAEKYTQIAPTMPGDLKLVVF